MGDLAKDICGLGRLRNVSVQVSCETWGSRGPRPPPRWSSASRSLVATVVIGADIRIVSSSRPAWICLGPKIFHGRLVRAALAGYEASKFDPRGPHLLGAI